MSLFNVLSLTVLRLLQNQKWWAIEALCCNYILYIVYNVITLEQLATKWTDNICQLKHSQIHTYTSLPNVCTEDTFEDNLQFSPWM